jgi:IS1 family transposase
MRVLSREMQIRVLHLLVEGTSLRAVTRLTGVHRTTIMRLMLKVGTACKRMMDRRMMKLSLDHLQLDEIWTFVRKKQARLTTDEQADDGIGDQFLFVALDEGTKLIPSFVVGKRTKENTETFLLDLASRVVCPDPALTPVGERTAISTDGWPAYPAAVDLAFADTVAHGVIIKNYADDAEQVGRYAPPAVVGTERRPVTKGLDPYSICTSHVERHNLSIRTFLRRFTRLALGFSKKLENLEAAIALYLAHYNFSRLHRTLKGTPAMRAGLAGHPWTMVELLENAGI